MEHPPAPDQHVPVNMWETEHALVVVAPMPGVTIDDVTVELRGGVLRLMADLRTPAHKDYRLHEFDYGSYVRQLDIGPGFGAPVTATLGNGLLAVSIAKQDGNGAAEHLQVQPVAAGSPSPS